LNFIFIIVKKEKEKAFIIKGWDMKNRKYYLFLIFLIYTGYLPACFTTLFNDGNMEILIHNKNDNTIIKIPRKKRRRFGASTAHAHFSIYMNHPNTYVYGEVYECIQNECGAKGNIVIQLSDIEQRKIAPNLFTIIEKEPYVPMVQQLRMVKKRRCNACER